MDKTFGITGALIGSFFAASTAAQIAVSHFDSTTEGWTTSGNGGAVPMLFGDYIVQQDIAPESMAFVAPAAYLGNQSSAYRGTLSFKLLNSSFPYMPSRPAVELTGTVSGAPMTLQILLTTPFRADTFYDYTVKLNENQPWQVVGEGRAPTAQEFRELLSSLNELKIIGDVDATPDEYFGLDEVRLDPATVKVFFLAGQSNMSGCSDVRNVDPSWQTPRYEPLLYWDLQVPNPGFLPLTPGTSTASCAAAEPQYFFGPELSFGQELIDLYPNDQVLIVKYAVGGTNLYADWTTPTNEFPDGGPMWQQLLVTFDDMFNALNAAGYPYTIEAFIWMQGESDGDKRFRANAYETKLTNFIAGVRSELGEPQLPFILGRVRDAGEPHIAKVRLAQQVVADADPWACWFDTDDLNFLPDGIHYDAPGQITLGQRFADHMYVFLEPRGDINRDGVADVEDLYEWTQNPVDLNCDGVADQADMDIVIDNVRADDK
ncbi:MAG TPA: hypothetical protein ENJ00_09175 [Phycisphaerales bacterium]|nr:hypothetical protein [Phycisphaerales bacterium]